MVDIPANTTSTEQFDGSPAFGATFSGEFEFAGDSDWIRLSLTGGTAYTFFGSAEGPGFNTGDSKITLRDATGASVFGNNDDPVGGTQNSLFLIIPPTTGTYFLEVSSWSGQAGLYSVAVTATSGTNNRLTTNDDSPGLIAGQRVIGDKGDDVIILGTGAHGLGEQGDDVIVGDTGANFISGGLGNDSLFGAAGFDRIFGDAGLDHIDGGDGNDVIYGGDGADVITDTNGLDTLLGGDGGDSIHAGFDDDFVFGELGDDVLHGENGEDWLDGGPGADEMHGGGSDDTFIVDNIADRAMEVPIDGTGDTVFTTVSYTLLAGQEIEFLRVHLALPTTALNLTGNEFANTLVGNNGTNVLRGGAGADILQGRLGNDFYALENGTDTVTDTGGVDTITSTITRSLVSHPTIERLTLVGSAAITGVGNDLDNLLVGNDAANTLNGGAGADTVIGGAGNDTLNGQADDDTLIGGAGTDTLIGNTGKDVMKGEAGNDVFQFLSIGYSLVANPDVVQDFDDAGDDKIDVSALFGAAMTYRHNGAFTAAGQVRINDIAGADVIVEVNTSGTLAADFAVRLAITTLASMAAGDFLL
jgi:Ca2+-binding RTX toxin-like protein